MVSRLGRLVLSCAALVWLSRPAAAQRARSDGFVSEPLTIIREGGTLHGTLLAPATGGPVPVVLIHPGSGPTDRDGNTPLAPGRNNSLRLLAEGLAARGVASLRIDKRGIGASRDAAPDESSLRFETYAADAAAWLRRLKDDSRFDRPSVQPYLISWFRHTPTDVVRRLSMPVLIAHGTTDLQVQPRDADALRAARPDAAELRVTGMNHVLKLIDGPAARQWQSYGDSTLAVAPALIEGIARFVHPRSAK